MNPDYFEKHLKDLENNWQYICDEKRKWYETVTKKNEYFNMFIKDAPWPNLYSADLYAGKYRKRNINLPEKPQPDSAPVELEVGQLVRFCEVHGNGDISKGEIGIIVDMRTLIADEVQVMISDDQLVWILGHMVEVVGESR